MDATKNEATENEKNTLVNDDKRYPLWDIQNNRAEIRKIAQAAMDDALKYNPGMAKVTVWAAYPRIAVDMLTALLEEVHRRSVEEKANVSFRVGNLVKITIEYLETVDADKFGSLNPRFDLLDELKGDYDVPTEVRDAMTADMRRTLSEEHVEFLLPQFFDDRKVYKAICEKLIGSLKDRYGIVMYDWSLPLYIFTVFMRNAYRYLNEHKEEAEFEIEIDFANVAYLGFEPFGDKDAPSYQPYMNPGQIFKKDNSKDDHGTEKE